MIKYIIICGEPNSGRRILARELVSHLNIAAKYITQAAIQDSFHAPLRHFIATALGGKYNEMDLGRMRPELGGMSVNVFLSTTLRYIQAEVSDTNVLWRWLMHRNLRNPIAKPKYVIVDDGELHHVQDRGPDRDIILITKKGFSDPLRSRDWNYIVDNDKLPVDLWYQAQTIAKAILHEA